MLCKKQRAMVLAIALGMVASVVFVASPARAEAAMTAVRYSFDADTPGARPAGVTVQEGDVEVAAEIPTGQSMRPKTQGGQFGIAAARFDGAISDHMTVMWRETSILGGDSHGFTLRHTADIGGYLFLINGLTTYEPNTATIYKVRNGIAIKLTSVNLPWSPRRTFVADAEGELLTLFVNDTATSATPGTWNKIIAFPDYEDPIRAGGLQYTGGWNGSDATRTTIDDLTAYVVPVAGVVDLISPATNQVVQRNVNGGLSDIPISGGYAGTPTAIEARAGTGLWQTADRAPSGGRFSGVLTGQPTGQGTVEVRFKNAPTVVDSHSTVGVGDVFVIAGQSNAVGHGWNSQPVSSTPYRAGLFGNDFRWKSLADPVDSPVGQIDQVSADGDAGGSVWPLVASKLMAAQNVPVAFIPSARNGTWIGEWQRNNQVPFGPHTLYGSMARRARSAGAIRAVLFWQGESDAFNGQTKAGYRALLNQFAADVQRDLNAPVVVAQIGEGDMPADNLNPVRLAQSESWDGGNTKVGPVLYDILPVDDGVHFRTDTEMNTAADRWYRSMSQSLYGVGDGRGPRIQSATLSANRANVTVVFTDASTMAGGTQGFSVAVGGSGVTVTSVTRSGNTFVINLKNPASLANVTVSLGKGHDGAGKQVPADINGLPADVFVDYLATQL